MADLDSRSKRASSVNFFKSYALDLVLPDAGVSQADRQQSAWDYSGILAGGGVVVIPSGALLLFFSVSRTKLVSAAMAVTMLTVAAATRTKWAAGAEDRTVLVPGAADRTRLTVGSFTLVS